MNLDDPQDRSLAAAEYVLGTLDAQDHAALHARLDVDATLRAEVYAWQDRLQPLAARVPPAEPDAALWHQIASRLNAAQAPAPVELAHTTPQPAANDDLWRQVRRWRATALVGMAASLMLASALVLRPADEPVRYITLLQAPDTQLTGWVVESITDDRIRLVPIVAAGAVPAGKTLQFWTKPQGAARPTSLGLVRPGERVDLPVLRSHGVGEQQLFELTLEPEGGSPTGLPTGPILYVGRSVRL